MNRKIGSAFYPLVIALGIHGLSIAAAQAQGNKSEPKLFPPNSPEHQALTASSPYLAEEEFYLRNDYWKGEVTLESGTAMRLQFFKGNTYRLFFGAAKDKLPPGAKLHLHIFDSKSKEVATASGKPDEAAAVLNHKNKKTGLYLIMMRIEVAESSEKDETEKIPSVLFYGWK